MTRIIAFVALALLSVSANASACLPWQDMLAAFKAQYGEVPAFVATASSGAVLTIVVNQTTHTYTVLVQPTADMMCVGSNGTDWAVAPASVIAPPEAPSIKPQYLPGMRGWQYLTPASVR